MAIPATNENRDEWMRLAKMLVAQGGKDELAQITERVCIRQKNDPDHDWNPAYLWGIERLKDALGIRLPTMPDPDWSLEDIEMAQQAYEKLK